ncbi:L-aminoadipate-semialdehyde dehydrogenase [Pseudozyma hubeiensis SY62]|uniref:L-aminoadipate-semialdehyde dehydrogenase n=1 Tax=Pseudozyma hubeiensis (strain SY62) TaxID=1305764 RepID=R9NWY0_PSEHS|nr:L-aminoadipate-semialdehyde dehydrogenase [Pseudozyma hubeiensis SY62]GAC93046.1 L-aminoadipate-semialdehyde dehydrogenase [Pseudozyma hubeiensis SY62]
MLYRSNLVILIVAAIIVAVSCLPIGDSPARTNTPSSVVDYHSPGSFGTPASPASSDFDLDQDLLDSILSSLDSDGIFHHNTLPSDVGERGPTLSQWQEKAGMEPPAKRRQLLQRIAKTVGWLNVHSPADAATLRNVIGSPRRVSPLWRPSDELSGQHDSAHSSSVSRFGRNVQMNAHADRPNAIIELSSDSSQNQGAEPSTSAGRGLTDPASLPYKSQMSRHGLATLEPDELHSLQWTEPRLHRLGNEKFRYNWEKDGATKRKINDQIFAGKLKWVDRDNVKENVMWSMNKKVLLSSRVLPLTNFAPIKLDNGGGTYNNVRMMKHGGMYPHSTWPEGHPLGSGRTFYMFRSVPEDRIGDSQVEILNYGIGYLDHANFPAVNEQLKKVKQLIAGRAPTASQIHI